MKLAEIFNRLPETIPRCAFTGTRTATYISLSVTTKVWEFEERWLIHWRENPFIYPCDQMIDSWIGVLMGTEGNTLHYLRRRYCCIITVSTRGQWHPDAIDLQGRTVMFCAPGKLLDELFDELFKQIASKFGSAYISQFMIIIPTNVAGRICGLQGSRFKSWTTRWQLQLDLRSSVVGNERLLVTRGTLSALNSFMFSFLETVDSGWQYETGVDNDGTPPRTKRRLENSARAQSAGKRRQLHQVVRVQSHAWRGTRLRGRLGPLNRT